MYSNVNMATQAGIDTLIKWGISAENTILGEQAYRIGLTNYIEKLAKDSLYEQAQLRWLTTQERWLTETADLQAFKDSINTILEDSLLDPSEDEQLSALLDSSLTEPVWYDLFPYLGPKWDMARNYLAVYDSAFINSVKTPDLLHLKQELSPPNNPYAVVMDNASSDSLRVDGFSADSVWSDSLSMNTMANDSLSQISSSANSVEQRSAIDDYQSCVDLNISPSFRGGIQALLASISYPEGVIISPVTYRFFINERGIIDRFEPVAPASNAESNPDLINAINDRLASGVSFEPTIINGRSVRMVCEVLIDTSELE